MDKVTIMYIVIVVLVAVISLIAGAALTFYLIKNTFVNLFNSTVLHLKYSFEDTDKAEDFFVSYDGLDKKYQEGIRGSYIGSYHPETAKFLVKLANNCSVTNFFSSKMGTTDKGPPLPDHFDEYYEIKSQDGNKMGHVFYDLKNRTAILVWASVTVAEQWMSVFQVTPKAFPTDVYADSNVKVHSGFLYDYISIRNDFIKAIRLAEKKGCETLIVAGISGGGAMSAICLFDMFMNNLISENLKKNVHVFTFGAFRVLNEEAASYFTTFNLKTNLRIINVEDLIPTIQPVFSKDKFYHIGNVIAFEKNYGDMYQNHTKAYLDCLPT